MDNINLALERILLSLQVPLYMISISWVLEMGQFLIPVLYVVDQFGIWPRDWVGLLGIFLSPFLHGGFAHLLSNTFPFIFLFAAILYFYQKIAWKVLAFIWFFTNIAVWLFARYANHLGASGLVFGFAAFLFFSGFFRKDFISLVVSLVVYIFYGSMAIGVLPLNPMMSYESHLAGAIGGSIAAYIYSDVKLRRDRRRQTKEL